MLVHGLPPKNDHMASEKALLSRDCADSVYEICKSRLLHEDCSLMLDKTEGTVRSELDSSIPAAFRDEYRQKRDVIVGIIMHSRYVNLYNLLRVSGQYV